MAEGGQRGGQRMAVRTPAARHGSPVVMLVAGLLAGSSATLLAIGALGDAGLPHWLGGSPAKLGDRLPATAEVARSGIAAGTCTALVLDRFTGVTAAIACAELPALRPQLPLRQGEIES